MHQLHRRGAWIAAAVAVAVAVAGCGGSSSSSSSSSSSGSASSHKGGTFTILANSSFGVADPAQNYTLQEWQLLIDTHDGLVQFKRVGGTAGTQLVPDLAESIPQPTDGGKTYTFKIRRGHQVFQRPGDEAERLRDHVRAPVHGPGPTSFYAGIVGASACTNATKTRSATSPRAWWPTTPNYTLTIHLTAPDPEFLDKLALPFAYVVPGQHVHEADGQQRPPGTGPYMWKSYNPNTSAVLVRNPYFHVWSAGRSRRATRTRSSRSTASRSPTR